MDNNSINFEKVIRTAKILNTKASNLQRELNQIEEETKNHEEQLSIIIAKTEKQLEAINISMKIGDDTTINEYKLQKQCKQTIEYFLHDIIDNHDIRQALTIRIEYNHMKIFKNITDEKMTFGMLKEETRSQFCKEGLEFFFTDENGYIFLNEIMLLPALFPLSKVKLEKYEPVIYVLDRASRKPLIELLKEDRNKEDSSFEQMEDKPIELSAVIRKTILKIGPKICYTIFLLLLITSYSMNLLEYRQTNQYRSVMFSLGPFARLLTNSILSPDEVMSTIKHRLKDLVHLPDFAHYNNGLHESLQKMKYVRLIQKRAKKNPTCTNDRIQYENHEKCFNLFDFDTSPIDEGNGKFEYTTQSSYVKFKGVYLNYNNSGYILDIPIDSLANVSKVMNPQMNWVNSDTASVMLTINYYSINTNAVIILRFLFERHSKVFKCIHDVQFVYLNQKLDWNLIACIVMTFIMILLQLFVMRERNVNRIEKDNILTRGPLTFKQRIDGIVRYLKNNYRPPTVLEIICLVNILFFYAMLIYRFNILNKYNEHHINGTDAYEDFQDSAQNYEFVIGSCCFNLIIFYVDLVGVVASYFDELQTITNGMAYYLTKVYYYFILFILPFLLISFYVSYLLFGDDFLSYYKSIPFMILKVIQTFDHGSMDHEDYSNVDTMKHQNYNQKESFVLAETSYRTIMDNAGYPGYIIYSLMYYLICIILIKGFVIGNFYLSYRDEHIQRLIDEERKRKEEIAKEKMILKNEEKMRLDQEMNEKREITHENKDEEIEVEVMDCKSLASKQKLK